MMVLYSCGGETYVVCVVNDLLEGLERTYDKLPEIGTGRAIFNAENTNVD